MSSDVADTIAKLEQSKVRAYSQTPMPSELDAEVIALIGRFTNSTGQQRAALDALVADTHSFGLLIFAERMAALAVREKSAERVRVGLLAIAIENFRWDLREDIMVMSLLYDSAVKIGADADATFRSMYEHAPPRVAQELENFIERPAELKRIAVMGYHEVDDAAGFRYDRDRRGRS